MQDHVVLTWDMVLPDIFRFGIEWRLAVFTGIKFQIFGHWQFRDKNFERTRRCEETTLQHNHITPHCSGEQTRTVYTPEGHTYGVVSYYYLIDSRDFRGQNLVFEWTEYER
jgi:hypothetical protein